MRYVFAFILAVLIPTICYSITILPALSEKFNTKTWTRIRIFSALFGITYLLMFCIMHNTEFDIKPTSYEHFPIEKLTATKIYFNNESHFINDSSIITIEEPNINYENVVIVENQNYDIYIPWKVNFNNKKYHVYMSEDTYYRFNNSEIIYERERGDNK